MEFTKLAREFHDTYERLAPEFGYETRLDTKEFDSLSKNGRLMIAVCETVIAPLIAQLEAAQADLAIERAAREDAAALGDEKIRNLQAQLAETRKALEKVQIAMRNFKGQAITTGRFIEDIEAALEPR